MAKTVIIEEFGGSDQLKVVDRDVGEPKADEVRIAHRAVGLNFIDVYQRTGLYPLELPTALGMEASGVIEAVGEGVTHLKVGDRAAYAAMPPGSYCEARVMPAAQVCEGIHHYPALGIEEIRRESAVHVDAKASEGFLPPCALPPPPFLHGWLHSPHFSRLPAVPRPHCPRAHPADVGCQEHDVCC